MEPVNDPTELPPRSPEDLAIWLVTRRKDLMPAMIAAGNINKPIPELQAILAVLLEAEYDDHRALVTALRALFWLKEDMEEAEARIEKLEAQMAVLKPQWRADA